MHWSFNSNEPGLDCAVHKVFPWPWLQRDYNHRRWLRSRSHVQRWDRYLKRNICLTEVVSFCHTCLPHAGSESNPLNKGARARASAGTRKEYTTQSGAGGNTGNVQKVCCDNIWLKNSVCRWECVSAGSVSVSRMINNDQNFFPHCNCCERKMYFGE